MGAISQFLSATSGLASTEFKALLLGVVLIVGTDPTDLTFEQMVLTTALCGVYMLGRSLVKLLGPEGTAPPAAEPAPVSKETQAA